MSEETVFSSEPTESQDTSTQEVKAEEPSTPTDTYADLLKNITREDGTQKYASVEDAFKALQASQEFIETLKAENATYKSEVEKRKAAEEAIEAAKANTVSQEETPSQELDLGQINDLIREQVNTTLTATEQEKIAQNNINSVVTKMTEHFGDKDKAEEYYVNVAKEAGISIDKLNELSAAAPNAVFKLAGLDGQKETSVQPSSGSVNTGSLKQEAAKPSAKVPAGATTKDMEAAWRATLET